MYKSLKNLTILSLLFCFFLFHTSDSEAKKPNTRYFEFTYKIDVKDIPANANDVNVWIPYPVSNDDQKITDMKVETPYPVSVKYDKEWGDAVLFLKPTPGVTNFTVTMTFKVLRTEDLHDLSKPLTVEDISGNRGAYARYLDTTQYDPIIDKVKEFTTEATRGRVGMIDKARGIYDFILGKMDYSKEIPGWGQGDIERACLLITDKGKGAGNCTDFHSLFTAMMRNAGIPAKFEMGYPLKPGKDMTEGAEGGYHCWAKFYVPGYGWIPVDISEASKDPSKKEYFFGAICENRVKFSEGRNILLEPEQEGKRLNYFGPDPYIEINGQPFKGFKRTMAYKDIK